MLEVAPELKRVWLKYAWSGPRTETSLTPLL